MSSPLRLTLTAEGSSDRWLIRVVEWAVQGIVTSRPLETRSNFCTRDERGASVADRLAFAVEAYPADLYFVHRDADNDEHATRRNEVLRARGVLPAVPCVPVTMSESWLLLDARAIRRAAGNPNGTMDLGLPPALHVELEAQPKAVLREAMKLASGLRPHRLERFERSAAEWPGLIGDHIESFDGHMALSSFRHFIEDTRDALRSIGRTV